MKGFVSIFQAISGEGLCRIEMANEKCQMKIWKTDLFSLSYKLT